MTEIIKATCERIVAALNEAGIPSDFDDGRVSLYGASGWELRLWPREKDVFLPVIVDLVLDRKLELDPYDGARRLWFDPLEAEDLGELRADCAEDFIVIVAATRAIINNLGGVE